MLIVGRNWTRVSITGSSLSPTKPTRHWALLAIGDVLGALLSLHSRCRTVKFRASKVEIIHRTAPTPGAFTDLGFDPQLSQTAAHCFISLSYLPIPLTELQKPYFDCWSLSLKEMMIRFLKEWRPTDHLRELNPWSVQPQSASHHPELLFQSNFVEL